ncbi:hypothetical protein [Streptomyces paromomycinus]|uniref:Uncharacterized protein n=1 Tax=Streptomyces paromomycinus TaxID=92743 RepID=A0A401VTT1_STREY|nr:hypothetical protein [Streptomyces paromomycinus]GCD40498.1 hypothetical protein GKJPGBOP_00147 [Streptomyces paromomycinus]
MVRRHQSAGPLPGTPTTAGSGAAALLALQRAAGNAAVLRAMEQERHTHGPGCDHHEERQDTVQRSAVHEVLRGAGSPLEGSLRQEADDRDHLEHEEHAGPRYQQMRPSKEGTRSANLRMQDRLAREAHAPNARRTPHVAVTHVSDEGLRYSSNSGQ